MTSIIMAVTGIFNSPDSGFRRQFGHLASESQPFENSYIYLT